MGIARKKCRMEDIADLPLLKRVSVDGVVFDFHTPQWNLESFAVRLGLPFVLVKTTSATLSSAYDYQGGTVGLPNRVRVAGLHVFG